MKTLFKLKPAKKLKTDYFVFDVETNGLRAKPDAFIFGVLYSANFIKVIHSVDDFKEEFLKPEYKDKKIFAHNAEYDLNTIFSNIYEMDSEAIFNGKFISASNGNCIFADSMNIYPIALKKLGSMIGIEKQTLSKEFLKGSINQNNKYNVSQKDIDYCIQDCKIAYEALFQAFEFSGQICITQASLSLAYFRRYHLPYNITHDHNKTKYFYNSYFGGRTECFKIGKTNAVVYDVNSMYPYQMKNTVFPNPKKLKETLVSDPSNKRAIKSFLTTLNTYEGTAHLKIKHNDFWLGFLPVRKEGKLIFPIGTFSGWWNFNEIRFALKHKAIEILEVRKYIFAPQMTGIFDSFVNHLYSERFKTSNSFEIYRIKIYMNSLYGKLAQRLNEKHIYLNDYNSKESQLEIAQYKRERKFIKLSLFNFERSDAFLIIRSKGELLSYSIPSFSSYITSAGRIQLLDKIIKSKDNVPVYCDTDSVFLENEIDDSETEISLSNIPKLGEWKLEEKIITNIRGLKNYEYVENGEEKRALKGVPKKSRQLSEKSFEYMNLTKTKEALRRNIEAGIQIKRTKILTEKYDKRQVLPNGETLPLILND